MNQSDKALVIIMVSSWCWDIMRWWGLMGWPRCDHYKAHWSSLIQDETENALFHQQQINFNWRITPPRLLINRDDVDILIVDCIPLVIIFCSAASLTLTFDSDYHHYKISITKYGQSSSSLPLTCFAFSNFEFANFKTMNLFPEHVSNTKDGLKLKLNWKSTETYLAK